MSSGLGTALGLTVANTWAQIVTKIKSIANRGILNWSGSNTTFAVPAGYYPGGTLDSRPSYNNGYNAGVTAADNRANVNSVNYKTGYNAGVLAGKASAGKLFCAYIGNCPDNATALINLTFYTDYRNLTVNDIFIDTDFLTISESSSNAFERILTKSYNPSNGILTLKASGKFFRYYASYYWPVLIVIKPKYVVKKYPTVIGSTDIRRAFSLNMGDWPYSITAPEQIALEILDWQCNGNSYEMKYKKEYNASTKILTVTHTNDAYCFGASIASQGVNVMQII